MDADGRKKEITVNRLDILLTETQKGSKKSLPSFGMREGKPAAAVGNGTVARALHMASSGSSGSRPGRPGRPVHLGVRSYEPTKCHSARHINTPHFP